MTHEPITSATGTPDSSCPYCRFAFKSGATVARCPSCDTPHHRECWQDNGGCAITGCAAAPADAPPAARPSGAPHPPPQPPTDPPLPPVQRGHAKLRIEETPAAPAPAGGTPTGLKIAGVAAVGLLAVAIVALTAVLLTRPSDDTPVEASTPAATQAATPVADDTLSEPAEPSDEPDPPAAAGRPSSSDIEPIIRDYYEAVLAGDFDGAWAMLSPSYRDWKVVQPEGKAGWLTSETDTRDRLTIGDVGVSIRSYDPTTRIATIDVTGMTWRTRDGSNCAYEGVTWVRRFDGRWRYDQGYGQRPGRKATWKPRQRETLGFVCTNGY